jgi:Family of unknown function (DUF5694)
VTGRSFEVSGNSFSRAGENNPTGFLPRRGLLMLAIVCCHLLSQDVKAQIGIVDQHANRKPTLVVLGTYHMGTPGNNVVNPRVADVTTPERQREIIQLIVKLKRFRPSKIVLECDLEDDAKTQSLYDKYLRGQYELAKNETNQIGFRLAKESGHVKVYCVDWSGFWDDPAINYMNYASKDVELDRFLKQINQNVKRDVDAQYEGLLPLSITDQLISVNQPAQLEKSHQVYFDLMRVGRGQEYIGANYVSWWYRRNLTILTNIISITASPSDRILVIFGVGHAKLLNQLARESKFYVVENPLKYLKK